MSSTNQCTILIQHTVVLLMHMRVLNFFFYLFEIEEEAGVLASFGEVGEKHCDTDEEHRGVLAHLTQRLDKTTATQSST